MAEVIVGVAASGAGLVGLAIQLLETAQSIREFHGLVKSAPDALLNLSHQLETVSLLLRQLETHRQHDSYDAELLGRCIDQCQHSATQMGALVQKLEKRLARLRILGRIMVALRDDEFHRLLTEIEQAKSSIMLTFQMYSFSRQMQQDQRYCTGLSQLRSAAENGNETLLAEIRRLGQSTWTPPRQDTEAGRIVDITESCANDSNTEQRIDTDQDYVPQRQGHVVGKKQHQKRRRRSWHYSINFAWLTSKTWRIALAQAENGWDFGIRAWNLRPYNSPIFQACRRGDLSLVQKLFKTGEASPYDYYADHFSLLHVTALQGNRTLCRFMLTDTGLSSVGIAESALNMAALHGDGGFVLAMYRLFIENSDFDPDLYEMLSRSERGSRKNVPHWLCSCPNEDCVRLVQQNQRSSFFTWPLESRIDLSMLLFERYARWPRPPLILDWIGLKQATPELALYKTPDGNTVLHMVAEHIGLILEQVIEGSDQITLQLAIDLVSLGADISAACSGKTTPFMQLLRCLCGRSCCRRHLEIKMRKAVNLWRNILQSGGVDVHNDFRTEEALLGHFGAMEFRTSRKESLRLRRLIFDEANERWDMEVQACCFVPLYRIQHVPGDWLPDTPQISMICWPPHSADENDCRWVMIEEICAESEPWILGSADRRELAPDHDSLLTDSQDDHGIIALRLNQRKPGAMRRCASMPCLMGQRAPYRFRYRCESNVTNIRPWLPHWHACPYDGRLSFDCDGGGRYEPTLRDCVKGVSKQESCVQDTQYWQVYHFDGSSLREWRKHCLRKYPVGSEESSFLTDDGRWVSTETWKTVKMCEEKPWWLR